MDFLDYVDDINNRAAYVRSWPNRVQNLKRMGYTNNGFCQKYGIHKGYFSRLINGKAHAGWGAIDKIEKAFKDAGA